MLEERKKWRNMITAFKTLNQSNNVDVDQIFQISITGTTRGLNKKLRKKSATKNVKK